MKTALWLIKLFPKVTEVNESDTAIHLYRVWTTDDNWWEGTRCVCCGSVVSRHVGSLRIIPTQKLQRQMKSEASLHSLSRGWRHGSPPGGHIAGAPGEQGQPGSGRADSEDNRGGAHKAKAWGGLLVCLDVNSSLSEEGWKGPCS